MPILLSRISRALMFSPLLLLGLVSQAQTNMSAAVSGGDWEPASHAITGARLMVRPGKVIENGVLLIERGIITAVGQSVKIPAGVRIVDVGGATVFAGFIDANSDYGLTTNAATDRQGLHHPNAKVHPEDDIAKSLRSDEQRAAQLRESGFTSVLTQPRSGIFRGQAALSNTSGAARWSDVLIASQVAQVVAFETFPNSEHFAEFRYPMTIRGAIAVIRQTLLDAQWHERDQAWQIKQDPARRGQPQPALAALQPILERRQPLLFDAPLPGDFERVLRLTKEFKLHAVINGNGFEYRHAALLKAADVPVIVPLAWPKMPDVGDDERALSVALADLDHWQSAPFNARILADAGVTFALTSSGLESPALFWRRLRQAVARGLDEQAALAALTTAPARILGMEQRLGTLERGRRADLVVADEDWFRADAARIHEVWVSGRRYPQVATDARRAIAARAVEKPPVPTQGRYPAGEYGTFGLPAQPAAVVIRDATIWTQGPQGKLEHADLLVEQGKVRAVGPRLSAPTSAIQIDGRGMHVTPGMIDIHSHTAVNLLGRPAAARIWGENAHTVISEVRVEDVLVPDDIRVYRQLAAGLTTLLTLPGSGSVLVGQGKTIKLRWGGHHDDLPLAGVSCAMKSAIGDNANMYNWGDGTRYPHTKMGVLDQLRDAFNRARAYEVEQRSTPDGRPLRRDLRMEGLLDILAGRCVMHIHSHRQDDIAAFLELAREYRIVPIFHHASDAYKLAPELAAFGAGAAVASDWWGFKPEAADEIPHNAALLVQQGVLTALHSDDGDLSYRPNIEVAKVMKSGLLDETTAMNLVTLGPARELGAAHRIGSLEPGKDADFVIWNTHPLHYAAISQQTWIDGRKYFDIAADRQERQRIAEERERLIALVRRCLQGESTLTAGVCEGL